MRERKVVKQVNFSMLLYRNAYGCTIKRFLIYSSALNVHALRIHLMYT